MTPGDRNGGPTLAPAVRAALASLRGRIRQYIWLDGVAAAAAWVGAMFWATLAVDWFFEPSRGVRVAMLLLAAAFPLAALVRRIGRRIFVPITDANAAMLLERRFPQLGDSLLTAVALGGRKLEHVEVSGELLDRTCREAAERMAGVDVGKVFDHRPLRMSLVAAVGATISVMLFAAVFPRDFTVWARRSLAFSDELWPRTTRLSVEGFWGGVQKVARGADLDVIARADATAPQVPQVVEVRYRTEGGTRGRATMDRRGIARGPGDRYQEYAYTFRSILTDIRFDVVGGDDRVGGLLIQAVDSPTISRMSLDCELPGYIGRKEQARPVSGVMQIPMGSRVKVSAGAANKELVRVEINGLVDGRPIPAKALEAKDLDEDRRGFLYTLDPVMQDTALLFTLTDADGIKSRDPVRLALTPVADQPPRMAVLLDGIGSAVTPQVRIPAVGRIDDDYGLGRLWFECAVDQGQPAVFPIADLSRRSRPNPTEFELSGTALEVRDLKLKPGQKISLCIRAADLCDLGRGANVAAGERWTLEVVAPDQLRTILESRELALRQRFERTVQEMMETRDILARLEFGSLKEKAEEVKRSSAEPGDEAADDSPERQRMLRLLGVQGALTNCRKSTQEVLGLSEAFDDIRKQLVNNRIDTEELKNRLQSGIADPLRRIAETMFPELERRLDALQPVLEDSAAGPKYRDRAAAQATDILLAMQKVLDRMLELEDFNEAVELLRAIIDGQEKLRQDTQRRQKERIRELLKDGVAADAPKKPETADDLSARQRQLSEKYKHLEEVLLRMAELNAATDPRRAALLRKAVAQSKEQLIAVRLERIVELLGKDQLSRATENQNELDRDLRSLLELLMSENRAKRIESEKARIREFLKQLGGIIKQEKEIQNRTAGGDLPKPLAERQADVADKTGELAQEVRKNQEQPGEKQKGEGDAKGAEAKQPAHKRLDAARKKMKEAEAKLQQAERNKAVEEQEKAIRELQLAKADLEEILRQLREEEIERMLAMLEARFRKMLQMQEEVYEGTTRLDKTPPGERTRNHEIEAGRLGGRESEIVVELDKALLLLRDDGSAAAFLEASEQMRDDMQQVASRLSQAKVNKMTRDIEEDIIAALKEMVESLKKAQKDQDNKKKRGRQMQGEPQEPPLVDALSELKMIRALQMRVNTRTERYSKMIEGEQAENAELVEALKKLAERQRRVHRVTHDLQTGKNK